MITDILIVTGLFSAGLTAFFLIAGLYHGIKAIIKKDD